MRRTRVDTVALVLAFALVVEALVLGIAVIIAVSERRQPPLLGSPTELILTTLTSGIIGLLGAYIGLRHRRDRDEE